MEKEITRDVDLLEEQIILLNMHSFLNIINILHSEILQLRDHLDSNTAFDDCLQVIGNIRKSLGGDSPALITSHQMQEFHVFVEQEIEKELELIRHTDIKSKEIYSSVDNIRSLFRIIHIRVRELLARYDQPETWATHDLSQIEKSITTFLSAIAKNSKGSYDIVYDLRDKRKGDYLVTLDLSSVDNEKIVMPYVLADCFRDLIANARKYTPPGGKIVSRLSDNGRHITIQVSDNGAGIPEDEIEKVVDFGYRASNVLERKTMGGGFGLSKAYFVTRSLGGRMWIESEVNSGTTITMQIPRNNSQRNS
ncbi:sensor histidine kinase [Balneolales bacterium ANBcel1]|nr:sensor histidine kinase [Balneolales bacterium ANBcel1]